MNFEEALQDQFVCGLAVEIAVGMEAAAQKVSTPAASTQVIHRYTKLVPVAARSEATQSVFVVEDQDIEGIVPHVVSNMPHMWIEGPHQSCLLLSWEAFREAIQGSRTPVNTSKVQIQWTRLHVKVLRSSLQDI